MVLKPFVASLDEVAEAVRSEYAEGDDGRFYLNVEQLEGYSLEDVGSLRSTLSKQKRLISDQKLQLDAIADLPDDVQAQLDELKVLREKGVEGNEAHESKIRQLTENHKGEIEKREARISVLEGVVRKELVTRSATAALVEAGANVPLLLPHVTGRMKVTESDGVFSVTVLDEDGETPLLTKKPNSTADMGVAEFVETLKKDEKFMPAFAGSGKSGGGAGGGDPTPKSGDNPWASETRNLTKQMEITKSDPARAAKLKREAGVA